MTKQQPPAASDQQERALMLVNVNNVEDKVSYYLSYLSIYLSICLTILVYIIIVLILDQESGQSLQKSAKGYPGPGQQLVYII